MNNLLAQRWQVFSAVKSGKSCLFEISVSRPKACLLLGAKTSTGSEK
jgi:hypothetical protein